MVLSFLLILANQTSSGPLAQNAAAIASLQRATSVEVRHVDGETVLEAKLFRRDEPKGKALLDAIAKDYAKRPNDDEYKCGFHADVALVPRDPEAPKFQLCFGCGEVRVELPATKAIPMRRRLQWTMNDRDALKAAVHKIYPAATLGRGNSEGG